MHICLSQLIKHWRVLTTTTLCIGYLRKMALHCHRLVLSVLALPGGVHKPMQSGRHFLNSAQHHNSCNKRTINASCKYMKALMLLDAQDGAKPHPRRSKSNAIVDKPRRAGVESKRGLEGKALNHISTSKLGRPC